MIFQKERRAARRKLAAFLSYNQRLLLKQETHPDVECVPVGDLVIVTEVLVVLQALGDTEVICSAQDDGVCDGDSGTHTPLGVERPNAGIGLTRAERVAPTPRFRRGPVNKASPNPASPDGNVYLRLTGMLK